MKNVVRFSVVLGMWTLGGCLSPSAGRFFDGALGGYRDSIPVSVSDAPTSRLAGLPVNARDLGIAAQTTPHLPTAK